MPNRYMHITTVLHSWSYHIVLALVFISIWVTMNVLCFGVTILLKKQYQILKNSLGRRHRGTDCREPLDLKGFVQDHVKLIRMTHMLRDILGPIVGAQMMQTIFITACATYVIAKPTAKSEYEVNFLAYSTMSLLELLALCWQSHVANQANENLGIGICHFSLTEPLGKNNRDWFLPLMMSQKTIKYKALGLVEINMETFLAVLRASYSYYTLIQAKA
ncbi:unnamed protein product [Nezara viridula]|uniref:Odorant receptor n=1 Tax=Nezara viridula TaxID=85310 RepID=A0A9P0HT89_NEZVI|nr:unnamed protein product [Nezara viridula]